MKNAFYIWITFQLLIIGLAGASVMHGVAQGTYECDRDSDVSSGTYFITLMAIPLLMFTAESPDVERYCEKQRLEKELGKELEGF